MMTKTLIVQFTPRGERSATLKLLKEFQARVEGDVEVLDLCTDTPDLLMPSNLPSYFKRDYMGETLTAEESEPLAGFDRYIAQVKNADVVVLAYPMYNFSFPAVVKAWFDGILLKGHTWTMNDKGFVGLMKGKKALVLTTSGGTYHSDYGNLAFEHSISLSKSLFQFMGFEEIEVVRAEGLNMNPDEKKAQILAESKEQLASIAKKWNC